MPTTSPGWYDDGRGSLRWWDGQQWTEHVQTPDPEPAAGEPRNTEHVPAAPTLDQVPDVVPHAAPDRALDPATDPAWDRAAAANADPSDPPGYPGGFPGGATPAGGFIAATEPRKSRLWTLWVVLGVVLLGVVILVAVLLPLVIGLSGGAASSGGGYAVAPPAAWAVDGLDSN